jgi:hypothetical protein
MISNLKKENLILKDSIKSLNRIGLNTKLIGLSEKENFDVNKNGKIHFYFTQSKNLPNYNVYEVDPKNKSKKLIYSNLTKPYFEYTFFPKNHGYKDIFLETEIIQGRTTTTIPSAMRVRVK